MAIWFAIVLGIVQGLSEFLPISSTAHLRLAPVILGQPDPGAAYTAVIQLGTLLAVLVYFGRDLIGLLVRGARDLRGPDARLLIGIGVGTLPIVVLGLSLKRYIVGPWRSLWVVAGSLVLVGLVMWWVDAWAARRATPRRAMLELRTMDIFIIGMAQSLALVPGVSRSGATIVAALLVGMARPEAARFSFLLSIPAIAGAGLLEAKDAFGNLGTGALGPLLVGTLTSALVGYAVIAWLLRWLASHRFVGFAWYRLAVGACIMVALATQLVRPDAGEVVAPQTRSVP